MNNGKEMTTGAHERAEREKEREEERDRSRIEIGKDWEKIFWCQEPASDEQKKETDKEKDREYKGGVRTSAAVVLRLT